MMPSETIDTALFRRDATGERRQATLRHGRAASLTRRFRYSARNTARYEANLFSIYRLDHSNRPKQISPAGFGHCSMRWPYPILASMPIDGLSFISATSLFADVADARFADETGYGLSFSLDTILHGQSPASPCRLLPFRLRFAVCRVTRARCRCHLSDASARCGQRRMARRIRALTLYDLLIYATFIHMSNSTEMASIILLCLPTR